VSDYKPTEEQEAILSAATTTSDNLILVANPGTGKTSTLEMVEQAVPTKPVLYLVFNKDNAKHAEKRMQSTTTVRTVNAMGHRVWGKSIAKNLTVDSKKCGDILRAMIKEVKDRSTTNEMWKVYWDVLAGVGMAKAVGYIPNGYYNNIPRLCTQEEFHDALDEKPDDLVSDLIDAVLARSIKLAYEGAIDHNDQVYMPAVFGGTFPQFPLGLVDEVQDMSPVNHALLHRLFPPTGNRRIIAVGDPNQAIYGFRGAKSRGMEDLAQTYSMRTLPLSISFRCPRAIVEAAQWRAPNFRWLKEGGHVETLSELSASNIPETCTFLCRNNAPLFRLAMHLLSNGRSVQVAGSDIGPKLVAIMRKLGEEGMSRQQALSAIADWQAEREAKESKTAKDLADCMRVFAGHGDSLGQAIAYAEHLFKQSGTIKLLTGHKAKGAEYETVFFLNPWLCREDEQDLNLRFVIQTRSADKLYEVDSGAIKW